MHTNFYCLLIIHWILWNRWKRSCEASYEFYGAFILFQSCAWHGMVWQTELLFRNITHKQKVKKLHSWAWDDWLWGNENECFPVFKNNSLNTPTLELVFGYGVYCMCSTLAGSNVITMFGTDYIHIFVCWTIFFLIRLKYPRVYPHKQTPHMYMCMFRVFVLKL